MEEGIQMKKVVLCHDKSCCPEVIVEDAKVTIGEDENICVLTKTEWEILREKILSGEL
jgi:hypothetical protein